MAAAIGQGDAIGDLLAPRVSLPYRLLLLLLVFNSFRPDRLLPDGKALVYVPTVLLAVLGVFWALEPSKETRNRQTLFFASFLAVAFVGALLARNQYVALMQTRSLLLYGFLPYLFFLQFASSPALLDRYLRLFVVLGVFFALIGIVYKPSISVPALSDENDFCLLMNVFVPLAYALGRSSDRLRGKLLWYPLVLLFILGNIRSSSRGGLVGLAAVLLYLFAKSRRKLVALAVLVALLVCGLVLTPARYRDDMKTIFTEGAAAGTGKERIVSWKAGWEMFKDYPLLGVGPMNFGRWFPDYYVSYTAKAPSNMWGRVAHSLYATLLSETGGAGTALFLLMVGAFVRTHRRVERLERENQQLLAGRRLEPEARRALEGTIARLGALSTGLAGAMIAYLVTGAFISVLWYHYFWMLLAYQAALGNASAKVEEALRTAATDRESPRAPRIAAGQPRPPGMAG